MNFNELTISELEKVTGTNRRTIHYYINEKLIPPAIGSGQAARYSEVHYLRLLIIGWMQEQHMKLSGIKSALNSMSVNQMREEVKKVLSKRDNRYISELRLKVVEILENKIYSGIQPEAKNISFVSGKKILNMKKDSEESKQSESKPDSTLTWHRHILMDGLEVNVRSDIQNKFGSVLLEILQQFKNSFKR